MDVLRLAAFPRNHEGGNPAGVVLDADELTDTQMQAIAFDVGFAETAFLHSGIEDGPTEIRYFSPMAEVPFCGHATIATAVALTDLYGARTYEFETRAGLFVVNTRRSGDEVVAEFTTPQTWSQPIAADVLGRLMQLLGLHDGDLDDRYPPRLAYAGNIHPLLVIANRPIFDSFVFDPQLLRRLMDEQGWSGTVSVIFASGPNEFEARNLFPVGSLDEDPATGAAAAALGGYLRDLDSMPTPARISILQGHHIGYPSRIEVTIPATGGIRVAGGARRLDAQPDTAGRASG